MTTTYRDITTAEHSLAAASEKPPQKQPQFWPTTAEEEEAPQLLKYADLPDWQKEDDKFVESGYRVATPSCARCLASWGYLHNETGMYLPTTALSSDQ